MDRFVQLHLLTSYAPANLNRDDLGRPKTAMMGGYRRLRVSSQSLKRAWRTSDVFKDALDGHLGTRTKEMGVHIHRRLTQKLGVEDGTAREWTKKIAGVFGKLKTGDDHELEIEQLAHFGPDERQALDQLAATMAERGSGPTDEELELLIKKPGAVDIALFGRMLASSPSFNVEAAAQVAHAISVHEVDVEDDFFTAVDDLNEGIEDVGAGHMGETEFAAAVLYLYVCIDRQLLLDNLDGDRELADAAVRSLVEAAATVSPTGKQNSFASRARASFILCEKGDEQPRSLAVAFLKPMRRSNPSALEWAVDALESSRTRMNQVYGDGDDTPAVLNALTGDGTLAAVARYATE
jgi:CRISPR system Cascade subunit CasC